jgi:hypothetical protein
MVLPTLANMYLRSVYTVAPITGVIGFGSSLSEIICQETKIPFFFKACTVLAYTTLGVCTGILYPITLPAIVMRK